MVQCLDSMGQVNSLPKGRRKSLRGLSMKNNLSHTFTLNESDDCIELLNVNIATEEELMTLPGVNRDVAKSIVEHRKAIGRFRKIEDLALVKGIGAEKLEHIRPEVCISMRKNTSAVSTRAPSYDSLKSTDSKQQIKPHKTVNVNKANVFDLQSVHGITQEIAAAIVHYREKKGHFKKVDDLIKIKNIDHMRLASIARFLTVDNIDNDNEISLYESRPSILTNGFTMPVQQERSNGVPLKVPVANGLANSSAIDIFELLSAYSPRPVSSEDFKFSRNGEPAVRVATWNLHEFSLEKVSNLGVKEVICRTILENGLSIIAVQDVLNVSALRSICEELNKPRLRRIKEWKDKNHNWNFCMLDSQDSKLGFIYDFNGEYDIDLVSLNEGPIETKSDCEVLVGTFKVGELTLQLVNLKLKNNANFELSNPKIKEFILEDEMMVVFVDMSHGKVEIDKNLFLRNLHQIFPTSLHTCSVYSNMQTLKHHTTNIWHNKKVRQQLTGIKGLIHQGLTHLSIPNGWSWGGPASPYFPVWTELYINLGVDRSL